jgi:HSP20 family molecular chaperone IbpA
LKVKEKSFLNHHVNGGTTMAKNDKGKEVAVKKGNGQKKEVAATFKDGVLEIRLPKSEVAKQKEVHVPVQ